MVTIACGMPSDTLYREILIMKVIAPNFSTPIVGQILVRFVHSVS